MNTATVAATLIQDITGKQIIGADRVYAPEGDELELDIDNGPTVRLVSVDGAEATDLANLLSNIEHDAPFIDDRADQNTAWTINAVNSEDIAVTVHMNHDDGACFEFLARRADA